MTAVKGQPSPKPQSLPQKPEQVAADVVASAPKIDMFAAPSQEEMDLFSPPTEAELTSEAAPAKSFISEAGHIMAQSSWPIVKTAGLLIENPESLPIAGGLAGTIYGPWGSGAGAAFGSAAKDAIELFDGQKKDPVDVAVDAGKEGAIGVAAEFGGKYALKGAAKFVEKYGPAINEAITGVRESATKILHAMPEGVQQFIHETGGNIAVGAEAIRSKMNNAITAMKDKLEAPIVNTIVNKGTNLEEYHVGQNIKQIITNDINTKYGPFKEAYSQIDEVNRALPIPDHARNSFTQALKSDVLEKFPHNSKFYSIVKQHTDSINASNTGEQLNFALREISDAQNAAYAAHEYDKAKILGDLKGRVRGFLDNRIEGIAKRAAVGKATPEELKAFMTMAEQRGAALPVNVTNPMQQVPGMPRVSGGEAVNIPDIKKIAQDFLNNKEKVRNNYAGFKEFMANLEEQTGVKSGGTYDFINGIDDIPAEKLTKNINNLFDKNISALSKMKKETPAVFDQISRFRVKNLIADSVVDGKLDAVKFYSNVKEMSPLTRNLIFSAEELKTMYMAAKNPRLVQLREAVETYGKKYLDADKSFNYLTVAGAGKAQPAQELGKLSQLAGENFVTDAQKLHAMEDFGRKASLLEPRKFLGQKAAKAIPGMGTVLRQTPGQVVGRPAIGVGNLLKGTFINDDQD